VDDFLDFEGEEVPSTTGRAVAEKDTKPGPKKTSSLLGPEPAPPPPGPPRPAPGRFSRADLARIRSAGPAVPDVVVTVKVEELRPASAPGGPGAAVATGRVHSYSWVPREVAGGAFVSPTEPAWGGIRGAGSAVGPPLTPFSLWAGLRRRDWTDAAHFDPAAPPWRVEIWAGGRDWGHLGYRVLVTPDAAKAAAVNEGAAARAGGRVVDLSAAAPPLTPPEPTTPFWVDMPAPGVPAFTYDYLAGGTHSGPARAKRAPAVPATPGEVGWELVFHALFTSAEARLGPSAVAELARTGWVRPGAHPYDCPSDALLDIAWRAVPADPRAGPGLTARVGQVALAARTGAPAVAAMAFVFAVVAFSLVDSFRKKMPQDFQEAIEFAQSKGRARRDGSTGVTFADVAGADAALGDVRFLVEFLKDPTSYASSGAVPPKGVLLEGPPGTGKTLIAKAIAGEAGVPFYSMSGSEFVEAIVGVGAARVRDLFKRARVQGEPSIVFIDEVDALGCRRAGSGQRPNEEREQTLNQLLTELDGFTPGTGVVFLAATNRADLLDPALLRPGRFDRKVVVGLPTTAGRRAILGVHAASKPLAGDVDLAQLAADTPGLSGAELAAILNEAALAAARRGGASIAGADIDSAVDRILFGLRRPRLPARLVAPLAAFAAHEAGVCVVAEAIRAADAAAGRRSRLEAVERSTVEPRGATYSRTVWARNPDDDYFVLTRGRMRARLRVLTAGLAGERALAGAGEGEGSTYASSNGSLRAALHLAQRGVGHYALGLHTPAGPSLPAFAAPPPPVRLGMEAAVYRTAVSPIDADALGCAGAEAGTLLACFQPDDDTRDAARASGLAAVRQAADDAAAILGVHAAALAAVRDGLLARGTLSGADVRAIMAAHPPTGEPVLSEPLGAGGPAAGVEAVVEVGVEAVVA
jgi:ATP-dependent metalloprotease FtsH